MPTGYTADVQSGKVTEFNEFAIRCARAFGALIMMRDDPQDAPIPEKFEPSDYHANALTKLNAERFALVAMSDEAADKAAATEYEKAVASRAESIARRAADKERYETMLAKVRAWTPPSADHVNMKEFMEKQLTESIDFDCRGYSYPEPVKLTGESWRAERLASVKRDIEYHTEKDAEEIKRANERTEWVRLLRESLTQPAVST
jgi:hypothetical protein